MKTVIISFSPRKNSNSLKVAKAIQNTIKAQGYSKVNVADFAEDDIPMLGRDKLDKDNLSTFQSNLIEKWADAQVVFLVAPEYNWFTSGQFFNAMHQLGGDDFKHLFNDKVFATVGVSAGRGGRVTALEMGILVNKLISFLNQYALVSARILESHETPKNIDAEGNLIGTMIYQKTMISFIDYTFTIARRWFAMSE